jgi:serine/threonine protein kinase
LIKLRDIKPGNILIFSNSVYKLADFGCSKRFNLQHLSMTPTLVGTIKYMAPNVRLCYSLNLNDLENMFKA